MKKRWPETGGAFFITLFNRDINFGAKKNLLTIEGMATLAACLIALHSFAMTFSPIPSPHP